MLIFFILLFFHFSLPAQKVNNLQIIPADSSGKMVLSSEKLSFQNLDSLKKMVESKLPVMWL